MLKPRRMSWLWANSATPGSQLKNKCPSFSNSLLAQLSKHGESDYIEYDTPQYHLLLVTIHCIEIKVFYKFKGTKAQFLLSIGC